MKRVIVFIPFVAISMMLSAQGFHFGPQIGFSSTSLIEKNELTGITPEYDLKIGYQIGAAAEIEIMSFVYVGASANFFQKGTRIADDWGNSKLKLGYIDIPIYIGYKVPIGNVSVFGNVGPYTSVAIVGKYESHIDMGGFEEDFEENIDFGDEFSSYKRFDSGLTFGGGVEFMQWQVKANYAFGFIDISTSDFYSAKNSVFNITCAYFIGRNY
jgi:hypothetical protein